ncbi:MAG: DUF3365 domain-containing protein [Brumimicrobium sp.]
MKNIASLLFLAIFMISCSSDSSITEIDSDKVETSTITEEELQFFNEKGTQISVESQQLLGKNLVGALNEGGTIHALSFCKTNAISLTNSKIEEYNVEIKRATDLARNPDNYANKKELEQIQYYKNLVAEGKTGEDITPSIEVDGDKIYYYRPIFTNEMCLQCHGVENEKITPETLKAIAENYPNDNATGYGTDEIRAVWSITFER